ncbi:biotin--protein ligase [Aquipluma nitroreducens]|uniref:Biotin--protein ligase n=1 Tax=Aquipluma nitroreducens TaxID=2010828 RepID=A0A5K7S4W5_9BACT|nr:biotin--[acetyl-CoA-carboxylase] ligase [Aquipluma nitroreducens]BBE16583.1 biotin--protein ligase [Aquipluma nitroreducens]
MDQIIGNLIVRLKVTDSTNNYANRQIRENGLSEGTVFLAYEQTSGRGQQNNSWESLPNENLLFSVVLSPVFLEIRRQFMISKVVALGIYKALNKYVDSLKIKWPNDIYAGNRKLGGILIENSIMSGLLKSSIVGIGLNVNQTIFYSNAPNPVSLKMLTNQHYDREVILAEILSGINWYYALLRNREEELIDREFISALYRINEKHFFKAEDLVFEGEILGVNEIGQLIIRKNDGEVLEFHFKEVEFLQKTEGLKD